MGDAPRRRTVWIVGASTGIGAALARAFAAGGARCVLSSRRPGALESVARSLATGSEAVVVPIDLADPSAIETAAKQVLDLGPVDVLVLNGGISQRAGALETDLEVVRRIMEVNFFGHVATTRAVVPSMVARRSGQIVVVSSVMGRIGTPLRSTYAASKHALHGWFESLRAELADRGVSITILCPGYVRTDISIHALRADGSSHAVMDGQQERGMDPDVFARKALRAIDRRRAEVAIGGVEIVGITLFRFVPALLRRIVRGYRPG